MALVILDKEYSMADCEDSPAESDYEHRGLESLESGCSTSRRCIESSRCRRLASLVAAFVIVLIISTSVLVSIPATGLLVTKAAFSWTSLSGNPLLDGFTSKTGEGAPGGDKGTDDASRWVLHPERHRSREPETIHLTWNVTSEKRAPDGVLRLVYLINGNFPGPTIEARSGDELIIDVTNSVVGELAEDGLSFHWHGLAMRGHNDMDGVVGLSQPAIRSSETYRYQFRIGEDESGTFWYHGHSGVQRADGLYGGLVVHEPQPSTDEEAIPEQLLMVGDWYHRTSKEVRDWFLDPGQYGYEPAPDSMLINGKGHYNCSMAVKSRPVDCHVVPVPSISVGSLRVRWRIINVGASAGLSLSLSGAIMKVVSVDGGGLVDGTPDVNTVGVLYPGERIDVILEKTNDASTQPTLTVTLDRENMKLFNYALERQQTFPISWPNITPLEINPSPSSPSNAKSSTITTALDLSTISGALLPPGSHIGNASFVTTLYSNMVISSRSMSPTGSINRTSWLVKDPFGEPLLALGEGDWEGVVRKTSPVAKFAVPRIDGGGAAVAVAEGEGGEEEMGDGWVDLVVHNLDDVGHPFHLHGNSFYIISRHRSSPGTSSQTSDPGDSINLVNPLRKDTVYIPSSGSVHLRLRADNPGLWLFHCHVLWHQAAGMGMVLQVGRHTAGDHR